MMPGLLGALLGDHPDLASAEQLGSICGDSDGFVEEEQLIARSVARRRYEFFATRHCARVALSHLGIPACAIGKAESGQPCWPEGIVGSLTHCERFCGAVVARQGTVRSVGIDAEPHQPLAKGVLGAISLAQERAWLASLPSHICADRILFCAKEATYKAWFPLTGRWLGFEDACIRLESVSPTTGRFSSQILIDPQAQVGPPVEFLVGSWIISQGLIVVGIVV